MRAPRSLFLAVVLVGCSGLASPTPASPNASPGRSVAPSPSASPGRPVAPSASLSTEPARTTFPTPVANVGNLRWGERMAVEGQVIDPDGAFAGAPGTFLTVSNTEITFSADGLHWVVVDSPVATEEYLTLNDVVIGPLGIVAVGEEGIVAADNSTIGSNAVVLLSKDGRTWERIADSAFADGHMQMAGATRQGFVVFGQDFHGNRVIWTSPDGREWLRATNETGLKVATGVRLLIPADGVLTAIVGPPRSAFTAASEFDVWRTEGRAEWERVGRLAEGDRLLVGASGGGRWIVVGLERAWTSNDGVNWTVGARPQTDSGSAVTDVAAYAGGYVAVGDSGSRPDDTCGGNAPWVGRTWTSVDGRTWNEHPTFERAAISRLVRLGGSILGLGRAFTAGGEIVGAAWTSALPGSLDGPVQSPVPTPSPTPRASSDGCGG